MHAILKGEKDRVNVLFENVKGLHGNLLPVESVVIGSAPAGALFKHVCSSWRSASTDAIE